MGLTGRRHDPTATPDHVRGSRVPLVANLSAFAVFFPLLILASDDVRGAVPLLLAVAGSVIAVAGCAIVLRSRAELGAAWSFAPRAGATSGLVRGGPYRIVRHPIYLGLSMVAAGEAVAFSNWSALLVVGVAVIPTFAWRAQVEEKLLAHVFGDPYVLYRERTHMIIPYLL